METVQEQGLFSYHLLSDKERKNLTILDLIRKKGPISRTEISKLTDINIVSVSNYIKDYLEASIVLEKGFDESSGGRRPELVELNKEGVYVIGVDINDSEIVAVVTNLEIKVLGKTKISAVNMRVEELAGKVIDLLRELLNSAKIDPAHVKAIGIGVDSIKINHIREDLEKKMNIPTFIGSDASCAAFGEKSLNPGSDVADLLYMHSDIGCGIIVRGDIYFGSGGSAGEMQISDSHISREEAAILLRDSNYLRPWNVYLGIAESAKREIEKGIGTKMVAIVKGDLKKLTKEVVIEAAKIGDEVALALLQTAAMNLGLRISYLINLFNPEVVIIGGGIEGAGDLILDPIKDKVEKFVFNRQASVVKIVPSALGAGAVSLGAASLAVREIFLRA